MSAVDKKKIAIVGTGISGLTCAYMLHQYGEGQFEITVFESDSRLGGHTATIEFTHGGRDYAVDTGFIVYNDRTYPNFIRLLAELGVETQPTDMSFSVSCEATGLEYSGGDLNGLFAQRANLLNPRFWVMLRNILRFNRQATADLRLGAVDPDTTLGEYLDLNNYRGWFASHYLVPMCSAIWSASIEQVRQFPLLFFVKFFDNHGLLTVNQHPRWRVIRGGSHSYIKPLVEDFADRIRLSCGISSVARHEHGVDLTTVHGEKLGFDEVVFACHSDQALAMLSDPSPAEKAVLGAIPYKNNSVVLHTDKRLLPKNPRAWAAWNYLLSSDQQDEAVLTYNMNILQSLPGDTTFCVTMNATEQIDPSTIVGEYQYAHPVFSLEAIAAQQRWSEINGNRRSWFCGAYWFNGFHEDGVVSALRVARSLGAG
ncbi:FAD-dependent oxidoreductase [Proteobacteria bacterium 005FR1]|nr:FAD-dependent oxidoreductase [Proteobacteria bacterium 005FR1]